MPVTEYVKQISGRTWSKDEKGQRKGQKKFRVILTDKLKTPDEAIADGLLPGIGDAWSAGDTALICNSIGFDDEAIVAGGKSVYIFTADYSTTPLDTTDRNPDPTAREGVLRLSYQGTEETIYQALDDAPAGETYAGVAVNLASVYGKRKKAFCNTAGQPFPDGLKETFYDARYTFTKNLTTENWVSISDTFDSFINRVNNSNFTITYRGQPKTFTAKTVLLVDPTSEPGEENGIKYEAVSFSLLVRKDGWLRKVLNQGTHGQGDDPDYSKPAAPVLDVNGDPVLRPVLLDRYGRPITTSDDDGPLWLKFRTKGLEEFGTGLGLIFPEFS